MNDPIALSKADVEVLAGRYIDGCATAAEVARLEQALAMDATARRAFLELCNLDSALEHRATSFPGPISPVSVVGSGGRRLPRALAGVASLAVVAAVAWWLSAGGRRPHTPHYDDRSLPVVTVATIHGGDDVDDGRPISPTTLRAGASIGIRSGSGADVDLLEDAVYGVSSSDEGALFGGSVQARLTGPAARYGVTASNLRITDVGTSFRVERIDDEHLAVTVLDGTAEVQSRVRRPRCFWSFDDMDPVMAPTTSLDAVRSLPVDLGAGAASVEGIVGAGALRFDNTSEAVATIDGGLGEKVGEGTLSMREGISLEALFVSRWSGGAGDYDELYRKEDGNCRVLLSFQNDGVSHAAFSDPRVPPGPCLSFGLHLAGIGYRELDMPLDGEDGRPTVAELTDGQVHHVVASYDSFTGRKSIAIDGVKRFEHVVPVGRLVLCGGPQRATIGNHLGIEPFSGVIDEVAIYDFALTTEEIAEHFRRASRGERYFEVESPGPFVPWRAIDRLVGGQTRVFNQRTAEAR